MKQLTIEHVKDSAIDVGAIAGGMIAANVALKATKKDTLGANAGLAIVGLIGATTVKQPALQMAMLGVAAFGAMRTLSHMVAPAPVQGMDGMEGLISEPLKAKIRKFLPTISGIDDEDIFKLKGTSFEELTGYEELTGDDDLHGSDEFGAIDTSYEEIRGLGESSAMLI